jgi:hypothetical protein
MSPTIPAARRRALELPSCPDRCPDALMIAYGCSVALIVDLIQAGLAQRRHVDLPVHGVEQLVTLQCAEEICAQARQRVETRITDLHFHDLRGTAITMLAEAGCTVPEIAL